MPCSERVRKFFFFCPYKKQKNNNKKRKKKATIPPRSGWGQKVIFVGMKMSGPPRPFFFFLFFFVRLKSSSAQLPNCNGFPSRLLIQRTPLVDWLSITVLKQLDHHTSALDGGKIKSVHIKSVRFSVPVSDGDDFTR